MTHDELTLILRSGDRPVPLPFEIDGRIRAAMHAELDEALDTGADIVVLDRNETRRTQPGRIRWLAAAAIPIVVGIGGFLLANDPESETATEPPRPYLVACLHFIQSTTLADHPWPDVLSSIDAGQPLPGNYLDDLANAIDQLLENPGVAPVAPDLRAAADQARSNTSDVGLIAVNLQAAGDTLRQTTGIPCLTETSSDP